jgi:hypothetical protein
LAFLWPFTPVRDEFCVRFPTLRQYVLFLFSALSAMFGAETIHSRRRATASLPAHDAGGPASSSSLADAFGPCAMVRASHSSAGVHSAFSV